MAMDFVAKTLNVAVEYRVASIQFNRPESLNAINEEMIKELIMVFKDISNSDDIDIVVLTGNERAFSSGGDIKTMLSKPATQEEFYAVMEQLTELAVTFYTLPALTISAVSGAAAGLGFSLALAADYIIADEKSKLAMNFIGIGLIPDGGGHFFLEKRMGEHRAKQLIWEGKMLSAREAFELGLVDEVTPDVKKSVEYKIQEWLSKPIRAMIKTKKIYSEKNRQELLKILDLEKHGQYRMRLTEDHQEGIAAFKEKRKPVFKGR